MKGVLFGRAVRTVTRRPLVALAATALLALGGAVLALRLEPSTATETLVDRGSDSFEATERFKRDFGDEAVLVLVRGELTRTVLTPDLVRVLSLEGCLSGNVPDVKRGLGRLPPVCREIAELRPAKAVYGPGTFVNTAATQIGEELTKRQRANEREAAAAARAARELAKRRGDPPAERERLARTAGEAVRTRFQNDVLRLALRYGLTDVPRVDSPSFVSTLVFDPTAGEPGVPKTRFAYLFPSKNAALIQIRMRPDLTDEQRRRAIALIEEATRQRAFEPREGARYIVTGVPVVAERLADAVQRSLVVLLVAAVLVMAAALALVFRTRLPLLPLALALGAAAMTFGALSLAGGSLTMAGVAVLPVLIGLAVDYAIQFQARFDEERKRRARRFGGGADARREAAVAAASAGGPTILTAGIATAVGFLVLLLSPVPMVRGFGALLVVGIAAALGCALFAGFGALVRFGGGPRSPRTRSGFGANVALNPDGVAARGVHRAREWLADRSWRSLGLALQRPRRVLAIALALAVAGLALDTQSDVVSDVRELVPQDLQALRDVDVLQEETGVSGEIDVTVRADDITKPAVVRWMTRFQHGLLRAHGYRPGRRCTQERSAPELCPALSLPDIFSTAGARQGQVRGLLDAVPRYFSQGVVTPDRTTANLAFGIRLMPLDRQKEVVDEIKRRLDPPPGVRASVVGLPVLAAEANAALSSPWRRGLTLLAALAGVFLVLLAARRSARAAAVPLIPIALATGWSGGVLFVLGLLPGPLEVDLNPMSVTLAALVIAISTEFSVLLSARYRSEREAGAGTARAIERAYASTGGAVLASGVTAIAGFAVLIASDIRMLRDFGIVAVVDLGVSLVGVMLVLPAALVWAEEHGGLGVRDLDPRPRLRALRSLRPRRAHADAQ
ncbi:MAG: MMPL family transporter [Thermoleophilaceae bacterium]|nr:MMPL family transporter [Thermoleophilaceae bacterium]